MIALDDLLCARSLNLEAERRRERVLRFVFPLSFSFFSRKSGLANGAGAGSANGAEADENGEPD